MTALQTSAMSLYEVSDLIPGQSLRARDLIRGGEPVLVSERSATQALKLGIGLARGSCRKGTSWSWPAGLAFTQEGSDLLITTLQDGLPCAGGRQQRAKVSKRAVATPTGFRAMRTCGERRPCSRQPGFLTSCRGPGLDQPTLHNREGDEVVFHEVTFPMRRPPRRRRWPIAWTNCSRCAGKAWTFWNWLGEVAPTPSRAQG